MHPERVRNPKKEEQNEYPEPVDLRARKELHQRLPFLLQQDAQCGL